MQMDTAALLIACGPTSAVLVGMLQRGGDVRGAHCESAMASSGCVVSGAVTSGEAMHVQ